MKKCMICGGQTLPGAKLCLPCRAALRRARDDTISELMPLPRRREAFAFSHSPGIGRAAPLAPPAAPTKRRIRRAWRLTSAQLNAAAVIAFVAAAGVLTFVMARELQRERTTAAVPPPARSAPETAAPAPRVSPSAMLGSAREEIAAAAPQADLEHAVANLPSLAPPPIERKTDRPIKARTAAARAPVSLDAAPASASIEPPVIIALPAPTPAPGPAPARVVPPDRVQVLAAALTRCAGDFFARVGCEHRARAQFCEGQWGQHPQCPAGIANDHGQ